MEQRFVGNVVEIWILYFFGMLAIAARIYCRTKLVGVKGYQIDDYLVIAVAVSSRKARDLRRRTSVPAALYLLPAAS